MFPELLLESLGEASIAKYSVEPYTACERIIATFVRNWGTKTPVLYQSQIHFSG